MGEATRLAVDIGGTFTDVAARMMDEPAPAHAVAVGDVNKDGTMDLAATGPGGVPKWPST